MNENEDQLWELAARGDSAAFAEIFDLHQRRVYNHAWRLTEKQADAEELTAIAFLTLWRRRQHVRRVDGSVLPWLLRTTMNLARNLQRAERRDRLLLDRIPPPVPEADVSDVVAEAASRADSLRAVRLALARLSPKDQEVLALCVLEELSTRDVSRSMGISEGTVKSRLSRAKRRLQAQLQIVTLTKGQTA